MWSSEAIFFTITWFKYLFGSVILILIFFVIVTAVNYFNIHIFLVFYSFPMISKLTFLIFPQIW